MEVIYVAYTRWALKVLPHTHTLAHARARAGTHTHTHTHKRCKSNHITSTWCNLDNANADGTVTFKP